MTNKQIIIDGLSCDNCPEAKRCQEQQNKKEYTINQVLQDITSEYSNVIARLKQIIPSVTRCDYVLEKQLKAKEQECEMLKSALKKKTDECNKLTVNYDACVSMANKQLDQLKAENEELKKVSCKFKNYCTCNTEKFLQTFTEIKEIAEIRKDDINDWLVKEILQKISEVE